MNPFKTAALIILTIALFILLASTLMAQPGDRCVSRAEIVRDVVEDTANKTGTPMTFRDFDGDNFERFRNAVAVLMTDPPPQLVRATGLTIISTKEKSGSVLVVHFENDCAFYIAFIPIGMYDVILNVMEGQEI
jgi:hypothetical protein